MENSDFQQKKYESWILVDLLRNLKVFQFEEKKPQEFCTLCKFIAAAACLLARLLLNTPILSAM